MHEPNIPQSTRTFICIKMPDEVVKEVARVQELVGKWKFSGKMTELANLHLTLKFLGEIDEQKIAKAREALSKVSMNRFEARLGEMGTFGRGGMPRIVWCKVGGVGVFELQKHIDDAFATAGFRKEERFMSHMTLARVKYVKNAHGFIEHVCGILVKEITWAVSTLYLMKSDLMASGPVYTSLAEFPLKY